MAERLGEYLIKAGILTQEQLAMALERQVMMGGRLGTNLIELSYLNEESLIQFLSKKLNIPAAYPKDFEDIEVGVIQHIPAHLAQKYGAIPLKLEKKNLTVAMADPLNLEAINHLSFASGCHIRPCVASEARIQYALERYYQVPRGLRYVSVLPEERVTNVREEVERPASSFKESRSPGEVSEPQPPQRNRPGPNRSDPNSALDRLEQRLSGVTDREEVIEILLDCLSMTMDRAVFLVNKNGQLHGWNGRVPGIDQGEIRNIRIPLDEPSLFRDAVEKKEAILGRGPLLKVLEDESAADVVILPLMVEGKVIGVVYTDNAVKHRPIPDVEGMTKALTKAAIALKVLILKSKILKSQ